MGCRGIDERWKEEGYIIKYIPPALNPGINKIEFPSFDNFSLQEIRDKLQYVPFFSKEIKSAIWQQYYELFVYHYSDVNERMILAPQVKVVSSIFNLPDIYYPFFTPLIDEDRVRQLNEQDLFTYLGSRLQWFGIGFNVYKHFTKKVSNLCTSFNLNEEDILSNPSNIGYHPVLGLRIIDYGLSEDFDIENL